MKTIVLISSGQPSANPRLVKEADLLSNIGYKVFVVYSFWINWAWHSDTKLFENVKWSPMLEGGSPYQKTIYLITKIRFKFFNFLAKKISFNMGIAEIAKGRAYPELLRKAKSIKADLYIAHNLAALPIAVKAAKCHKVKCGFDAEDFHRQEVSDDPNSYEYKLNQFLEDKYLTKVDYITAASPLIASEYVKLFPGLKPIVINNVFSIKFQTIKFQELTDTINIRLFWFSQTIGKGRGLEDVIKAMGTLQNPNIELTLLGKNSSESTAYFKNLAFENGLKEAQLKFIGPVAPDEIFSIASQYDIGLALELDTPLNRNICLTNKIFTYIISGLAIIASETRAQKQLIQTYIGIGKSYPIGSVERLAEIIYYYYSNKDELTKSRKAAYELAKIELNWEHESKYFLSEIKRVIE